MVLLEYREPMFHYDMMEYLDILNTRYNFMRIIYIGKSPHGKSIPAIKIGMGDKNIIYTAGLSGNEMLTSIAAMRFINEYCEFIRTEQRIYNIEAEYIFRTRSVYVIPMVNPDSIEISRFLREHKTSGDLGQITPFIDTLKNIKLLASLRLIGDYVNCADINMRSLIKLFARMTGNDVTESPNVDIGFEISCDEAELFKLYMRLREFLFTAPVLC
jgi:Zinc carboxypeptidase.